MKTEAGKHHSQMTSNAQGTVPAALRRSTIGEVVPELVFHQIKERGYNLNVGDLDIAVPVEAIDQASDYLTVSKGELMKILRFSPSSLSTWAKKPDAVLPASESDRLARLARIIGVVEHALESREDTIEWLTTPVPALGSQKPISLLGTDAGARMVENTLMRSLAGVYA